MFIWLVQRYSEFSCDRSGVQLPLKKESLEKIIIFWGKKTQKTTPSGKKNQEKTTPRGKRIDRKLERKNTSIEKKTREKDSFGGKKLERRKTWKDTTSRGKN